MTDTWDECVAAIKALPWEEQVVMSMRFERGLSAREIALVLKVSEDHAQAVLERGIAKCQPRLE